MRVLYFGTYERHYPRNAQVISALRSAGAEVLEQHVPVWESREHKFSVGIRAGAALAAAELRLLKRPPFDFDAMIVGYPGHFDMLVAHHAAGDRPIVFNPLVSLEDTVVNDRRVLSSSSVRARMLRVIDRRAFRGADLVVADTDAHARYFTEQFDLEPSRAAVCFVGADDGLFQPGSRHEETSEVLFVGKLIPLHGIETILEAARLCPEIPFRVVGSGQLESVLSTRPDNVRHQRWVEYSQLPALYRSSMCALGVFGTSAKAARVIPNKAYQALATATPLVTADTPGARELLEDEVSALLVPPGDPSALAIAIQRIARDTDLRVRLSEGGLDVYRRRASEDTLGRRWLSLLERLV
jgi:glycosyltransferase involved in cell wall biosynthesis